MALDLEGILRGMLPPLLLFMLPPSLPQVVVPIPSLLAFPFISENATATYVSVSFALAFAVGYRSRTKRDAGRGGGFLTMLAEWPMAG